MSVTNLVSLGDLPIIVGGRGRGTHGVRSPAYSGPLSSMWATERRGEYTLYFQRITGRLFNARILAHGNIEVPCYHARMEDLNLIDNTLQLVPPMHIQYWLEQRPQGIRISDSRGRHEGIRYTGGVNPEADYAETTDFDESQGILITFGALWEKRDLNICPTLLHEIGHRMTHRGALSYSPFPDALRRSLSSTRVSMNPGEQEALCNAYMFMLCYGATDRAIQQYGTTPINNQKQPSTRAALRETRAFSQMINSEWLSRYIER